VIDPEHGGHDTGAAESTTRVEGTQERDANTEFALGVRYALGTGVARNDKQAFRLFKRAGERGNVSAQSSLAMSYWLGRGIRQNNAEAYSWATIAYERGDPPSGELLKVLVGMMSQTELTEGTRKAQEWQRRHSAR
jgi:TPR repeat protein